VIVNPDQFCQFTFPDWSDPWDAFVPINFSASRERSYVTLVVESEHYLLNQFSEKRQQTPFVSVGIYGFRRGSRAIYCIEEAMRGKPHHNEEYFVAPSLEHLTRSGGSVWPTEVLAKYDLGDIKGLDQFETLVKAMQEQ